MLSRRKTTSTKKRFRTEILIDEHLLFLKKIEDELRLRNLGHKIVQLKDLKDQDELFEYLFKNDSVDLIPTKNNNLKNFDVYEGEELFDLPSLDARGLIQVYKRTLIRCHVIKKFNVELEYGRKLLGIAMRNQHNLGEIRERVTWLEKEIEKILLTNKNIQYPMQKKIFNEYPHLLVKKVLTPVMTPVQVVEKSDSVLSITSDPDKLLERAIRKWDKELEKKSGTSTCELLESNDESRIASVIKEETEPELVALMMPRDATQIGRREENLHSVKKKLDQEETEGHQKVQEYVENKINYCSSVPSAGLSMNENASMQARGGKNEKLTLQTKNFNSKVSKPFYELPHNRYTNPEFSRSLVSKDPNSYHRLGIAVTDSYLENDNAVDGSVPHLDRKVKLHEYDTDILGLARKMKDFYQNIYETTTQKTKFNTGKDTNLTESITLEENSQSRLEHRLTEMPNKIRRRGKNRSAFQPAPLLFPSTPLPQTKYNQDIEFPRTSKSFLSKSANEFGIRNMPKRIVNQHNLKEQTKLVLFRPKEKPIASKEFILDDSNPEKEALYKKPDTSNWNEVKPVKSELFHSGLKYEKIKSILSINLKSTCFNERKDAVKHLGLLGVGDNAVIFALNNILSDSYEHELIKFETARSLILLGDWNENVCDYLKKNLLSSNLNIREELMKTIIKSKNVQFTDKNTSSIQKIVENLVRIVKGSDEKFALNASICIGKLGVKDCHVAIKRLVNIIETSPDWNMKSLALEAYVRHFESESNSTVEYIINQIAKCPIWVSRSCGLKLLSFVGIGVIARSSYLDEIYDLLEAKLSDDPIREVRLEVGNAMKKLQLFDKVFARMEKNLNSHEEEVRAKAVTAMEMLGVNKSKVLTTLIDMLELDNSEHVRSLVMKALYFLAPNNPKVIFAFNGLEKNSKVYQTLVKLKNQNKSYMEKSKTF